MERRDIDLGQSGLTVALEHLKDPDSQKKAHKKQPLSDQRLEAVKATFIATGGNVSATSAEHHVTTDLVLRLASENKWPVYGGGTTSLEASSKAKLEALHERLWLKIEKVLDSLEVEKKQKQDIVQYRSMSSYVEPLASRNQTFKMLFDQYMRIGAMLNPEVFGDDPAIANGAARKAQETMHPDALGGVSGVNRELADFIGRVAVGVADEINRKGSEIQGEVVDEEDDDAIDAEVVE